MEHDVRRRRDEFGEVFQRLEEFRAAKPPSLPPSQPRISTVSALRNAVHLELLGRHHPASEPSERDVNLSVSSPPHPAPDSSSTPPPAQMPRSPPQIEVPLIPHYLRLVLSLCVPQLT